MKRIKMDFVKGSYCIIKCVKTAERQSGQGNLDGKFFIFLFGNICALCKHNLSYNQFCIEKTERVKYRCKLTNLNNNSNCKNQSQKIIGMVN
jgi:hypothetical protein